MKNVLFILAFLCTQSIHAQYFQKIFSGKINDKYAITMLLDKSGFSITGTYQYKKVGLDLYLAGNITNRGEVDMKEFSPEGDHTGSFKGNINGSVFTGVWTSADGKKKFTFYLTEQNSTDQEIERLKAIADDLQEQINRLENSRN